MVNQPEKRMPVRRVARPGGAPGAAGMNLTPKDIVVILRKHLWLIIILTILGAFTGVGSFYVFRKYMPQYTAKTMIKVLPPVDTDPLKVENRIVNNDVRYGYRQMIASLIKQQTMLQDLLERDNVKSTTWFKKLATLKQERLQKGVEKLEDNFGASPHRESDFVILSMRCGDPKEAALIVNEMVDMFVSSRRSSETSDVARRRAALEERRVKIQQQLDAAEEALDEVRRTYNVVDLAERTFEDYITKRVTTLQADYDLLIQNIQSVRTSIANLQKQMQGPADEQVQVARLVENDPTMIYLKNQMVSLETTMASYSVRFGENHREVKQIKELLAETRERRRLRKIEIAEQTRNANLANANDQYIVLMEELQDLEARRAAALKKKEDVDKARVLYARRVDIRDERRTMLNEIIASIETLNALYNDPKTPKVIKMGDAPEPLQASFPKLLVFAPGGVFLGMALGIGLAFLIELLNDLVRTPRDVERHLHAPMLCMIPDINDDRRLDDTDEWHVMRDAPFSMTSECYRKLRANLKLTEVGSTSKTLLVTSCGAGDGKTSVAVNMANSLVAEGHRVLLVDINFWKPSFHKVFSNGQSEASGNGDKKKKNKKKEEVENYPIGLSNYLADQADLEEVIQKDRLDGLDFIPTGPHTSNHLAELLSGSKMKDLFLQLREVYDYVIIDGPPVLLVSAVKVVASNVDGTIFVVNASSTHRGAAVRALKELSQVKAKLAGCVLFGAKTIKGGYFQEQFKLYEKYQSEELVMN